MPYVACKGLCSGEDGTFARRVCARRENYCPRHALKSAKSTARACMGAS